MKDVSYFKKAYRVGFIKPDIEVSLVEDENGAYYLYNHKSRSVLCQVIEDLKVFLTKKLLEEDWLFIDLDFIELFDLDFQLLNGKDTK